MFYLLFSDFFLCFEGVFSAYQGNILVGASTGVPTHDKVMWESPDGQGESGLGGAPLDLPERLPQSQNLSVLLSNNFHHSSDINWGLSPTTFL